MADNWTPIPLIMAGIQHRTEVLLTECESCLIVEAVHTVTVYTGAVYDPDDGLPLAYEGERTYGDGRLFPMGKNYVG